jgi:phosphoglucosamine mutase
MLASGKSLAAWYDELPLLPQKLLGVPVRDKQLLNHPTIQAFIAEQTAELGREGRLNIRPSGTEPIVRVMVEAADAETRAVRIAAALQEKLAAAEASK